MPDVKVVQNIVESIFHVAGNGDMPVRYECCDDKAICDQILHALLKCQEFHRRAASCLVSLKKYFKTGLPVRAMVLWLSAY